MAHRLALGLVALCLANLAVAQEAVICFGDSITAGPYPSFLAERLSGIAGRPVAVFNEGIGGNRILHDSPRKFGAQFGIAGVKRFKGSLLSHPEAHVVIVLEGINDIQQPGPYAPIEDAVTAEQVIAGLRRYIDIAHELQVKIIGATILPFEGCCVKPTGPMPAPADWPQREVMREQVNHWIRSSKAFDGVVDFDQITRDPQHPKRMLTSYDRGDHLHPNDTGYRAMAEHIDLALLR